MTGTQLALFLVTIFGVVIVGLAIVYVWLRNLAKKKTAALLTDYPIHEWVIGANFFGRESDGMMQVRGNGTLLLTRDKLVFMLWMPEKRYVIPLRSITAMSNPRGFLGKSKGGILLRINYTDEHGKADAVGFLVRKLDEVQASIEVQRR